MTLVFPDDDALRLAVTGGAVPASVSLAPARVRREADGSIGISPRAAVPEDSLQALRRIGVRTSVDALATGQDLDHWLQAMPLVRDRRRPVLTEQSAVLFELGAAEFSGFSGEMMRLGNDRQSFRVLRDEVRRAPGESGLLPPPRILLRVLGPPYYSLLRANDRWSEGDPRAYYESSPGIWIKLGWSHPLADQLRAPDGQWILIRAPNHWSHIDESLFQDIYEALDAGEQPECALWETSPTNEPLHVPLRLSTGNTTAPPELWVLPHNGEAAIDALVRDADARLLNRLSFAVGESAGGRIAVLRTRPGKGGPPELTFDGALTCRPYERLPNLFLPCGTRLEPPLRRESVRRLLADDGDAVTWLIANDDCTIRRQSLPEAAFRPLGDWPDHVLSRERQAVESWVAGTRCDFRSFISREELVTRPAEPAAPSVPAVPQDKTEADAATAGPRAARPARRRMAPAAAASQSVPAATATPSQMQIALRATEQRFLALDGPLDMPARQAIWPELGRLNGALGHIAESSLCWLHALWESPAPDDAATWGWVQAERALPAREMTAPDLARLCAATAPTAADLRPLAAAIVWGAQQKPVPAALVSGAAKLQQYLERHDRLLPVRAVWLVWQALGRCAGGDELALARVRDRLLERLLKEGLSPDRDLPGFLRFSGQQGGDRMRTVRDRMERLRLRAQDWCRRDLERKPNDKQNEKLQESTAYIDLMFAFAAARLGEAASAGALVARASEAIDASGSDAHRFLLQAFQFRIDQVLAGRPHAGPLPPEQIEYLEQMRRDEAGYPVNDIRCRGSYVVDRLREQSQILDPAEHFNPYRFIYRDRHSDAIVIELNRLPDIVDKRVLADRLRRLLQAIKPAEVHAEVRMWVLADALPLAARVGESLSREFLDAVVPALDETGASFEPNVVERRTRLLDRAVFFAAHFDRADLAPLLISRLESVLAIHAPTDRILDARSRLVGQSLRSLRKLGLSDASDRLLEQFSLAILGGQSFEECAAREPRDWIETLCALLHLAGVWLSANQPRRAWPILDAARAKVFSGSPLISAGKAPLYVSLVCNYVTALARAPLEEALDRVEELFASGRMPPLPNTFTTSPYYSRFHLNIVEAIVLSLANEEFAIGPAARRWLDDDEYLIRRRIHRDVRSALEHR